MKILVKFTIIQEKSNIPGNISYNIEGYLRVTAVHIKTDFLPNGRSVPIMIINCRVTFTVILSTLFPDG